MRIYTSANDPLDFCVGCLPPEDEAREEYGNVGEGPDGRGNCFGYNTAHPSYDSEGYKCDGCGKVLDSEDD